MDYRLQNQVNSCGAGCAYCNPDNECRSCDNDFEYDPASQKCKFRNKCFVNDEQELEEELEVSFDCEDYNSDEGFGCEVVAEVDGITSC